MNRVFNFQGWFRQSFAPHVPAMDTQARGTLLMAAQDEPEPDEEIDPCPRCKGRGEFVGSIDGETVFADCPSCDGTGER